MFKKGNILYSIFNMKCPKCHEGQFFVSHPYNLKTIGDILTNCPNCNEKYEKEPGFYFGAMFISYALTVGLFLTLWFGFSLFYKNYQPFTLVLSGASLILIFSPFLYSLSKIIWANIFIKYDAKKGKLV